MTKLGEFILLLIYVVEVSGGASENCRPRVAIVGGGIGGASAAHFLSELFENDVDIDLFEANKIGGRLATININDNEFEAGGAIIHDRNKLMRHFLEILDLKQKPSPTTDEVYGIWNGDEFVFKESNYEIATLLKLMYRYGLEPIYLYRYVNKILDDFENIYKLQDHGRGFLNVNSLLSAMNNDFASMLEISIKDHLLKLGYSEKLIDELVEATLVVNYGQDTDVQSFVGLVSIAGAGSSLWSVKGGNKRVVEELIKKHRNVQLKLHRVKKITFNGSDEKRKYTLTFQAKGESNASSETYDIIIIATPLTSDQEMPIDFENFPNNENFKFTGNYQTTYATFLEGKLNATNFDLVEPIQGILSCDPRKTIVSSLGKLSSVEGQDSDVWKIFTRHPLTLEAVEKMFSEMNGKIGVITHEWKAYPKYSINCAQQNFKLYDNLYHVNAIEWAASAMEMSAIGGRNVAILAHNDFMDKCKLLRGTGAKKRKLQSKTEL